MIIVKLKGGLGNQLFQYGFGRRLALLRHDTLKLDATSLGAKTDTYRTYGLVAFNIKAELATPEDVARAKPSALSDIFNKKILRRFHIGWEPHILASTASYFDGYWQSYQYLDPIRSELLTEITLKKPLTATAFSTEESVAIHIRRGDYVNDAKTNRVHQTFGLDYYDKALKHLTSRLAAPRLSVFSDDIAWVKQNFQPELPTEYVSSPDLSAAAELILMSRCRHQIIANSTFSWWAAWLNQYPQKIVIAPKKWSNSYQKYYDDLIPHNWLRI